jgi:hypothetical protein
MQQRYFKMRLCEPVFAVEGRQLVPTNSLRPPSQGWNSGSTKIDNPKAASGVSPFREACIAYSQFSGDAAHPTLTALRRHLGVDGSNIGFFDVSPDPKEAELDETLHLAFIALIGAMVVVNEMNGYTKAGTQLPVLNGELIALQTENYGAASLARLIRQRAPERLASVA